jgi:hypothetical protein
MHFSLKKAFLYIFASVGLVLCVIGLVSLINLGLRTWVFTKSDYPCYQPVTIDKDSNLTTEQQQAQADRDQKNCEEQRVSAKQTSASNAIAMLIVGLPLYLYHWKVVRRETE